RTTCIEVLTHSTMPCLTFLNIIFRVRCRIIKTRTLLGRSAGRPCVLCPAKSLIEHVQQLRCVVVRQLGPSAHERHIFTCLMTTLFALPSGSFTGVACATRFERGQATLHAQE